MTQAESPNVFKFPLNTLHTVPDADDELARKYAKLNKAREQRFIERITQEIVAETYSMIEDLDLDLETDVFKKDFTFAAEAIRATVYRLFEIEHHLHEYIDGHVRLEHVDEVTTEAIEKGKELMDKQKKVPVEEGTGV